MKQTVAICLSLVCLLLGCSNKLAHKDSEPEGPAAATQTKSYHGVGIVKGMDPTAPTLEIDHEDIKGLMPAMQMNFHIKSKDLLQGLSVGDRIEFTVENGVGGLLIVAVRKTS